MTEDEAKARQCCGPSDCGRAVHEAREVELPSLDGNPALCGGLSMRVAVKERYCAGSSCMAWRWDKERKVESASHSHSLRKMVGKDGWRVADGDHAYSLTIERDVGYCGLAGKS